LIGIWGGRSELRVVVGISGASHYGTVLLKILDAVVDVGWAENHGLEVISIPKSSILSLLILISFAPLNYFTFFLNQGNFIFLNVTYDMGLY
jgi:hypothetical protein